MKQVHFTVIFSLFTIGLYAQEESSKAIKIIPETSMKIGSQKPAVGAQFGLVAGLLLNEKYMIGVGAGYATNMGMGGAIYPLYIDGRFYFSTKKNLVFAGKDEVNDFQVEAQFGININNNKPYKTGLIAAFGFAYRFDFIKIKRFKFPFFYAGLNLEYNHTKFKDEYRGFVIKDGYLNHTMLSIKVAFDINPIKI